MASNTENIGARGRMRVRVDLVSQDSVKNTSKVRVRGDVWITSGSSGDDTGNCKARFTGTNSTSNKTVKGNYSDDPRLILDETFTVSHDSDGTKKVTYTFHFGPTITPNLGKGGTATVSMNLPQLSTKPGKVTGVGAVLSFPATITVSYSLPSSSSAILEYQIEYAKNSGFTGSTVISAATSLSKAISDLDKNSTYYFRVRARNTDGWGEWSDTVNKAIPDVPSKMATPTTAFTTPATITVSFVAPSSDGGSPLSGYDVQYSTTSDFAQVTTRSLDSSPLVLNNLTPNAYYFRVRAKNLVGEGPWSDAKVETIISGPKISIGDVNYPTLVFVRYNGIYRTATPYVRQAGVWRIAGG